ncbi:hypothetical protein B296_00026407 [Ensete ventricosum]|uniref:Uncharacterized protein n=1 Tax=Ensete ventricosum TaxID=4639 RepID=A0A427A5Y9_ENSVE|nr:hypothetical protein B296_00026407 [Ensete ventricosum]
MMVRKSQESTCCKRRCIVVSYGPFRLLPFVDEQMALESAKRSLEAAAEEILPTPALDALPSKFYDAFVLCGLRVDLVEPGHLLCSMTVPPRLLVSHPSLRSLLFRYSLLLI